MEDLRVYVESDGRVFVGLSKEVATALAKKQGTVAYRHSLSSGSAQRIADIVGAPVSGLLSTDERWSRGVYKSGLSSSSDMSNGSCDRVYLRAR